MIRLQTISSPLQQRRIFAGFDPARTTWVVSDLRSKFDLQRTLLRERNFLPGESVLRASELWDTLLTRLRPDLQCVSREFAITLIGERLSRSNLAWAQSPGAAQTAYSYLTQLMPILAHPEGRELLLSWFEDHPSSQIRWGHWFDLTSELWGQFLEEGLIAAPWISGILVNEVDFASIWDRDLVVDLGAEMNQVEADLLLALGDAVDVLVIQPEPVWAEEYRKTLFAYEILTRAADHGKVQIEKADGADGAAVNHRYLKFTTMIAEVKHATATVRSWLDSGLAPEKIALVAPDLELYWPSLSAYLREEGVPVQKDTVARVHSFPEVAAWLSRSRARAGDLNEADLEFSLFASSEFSKISYDRFKVLYSTVYGREDLLRDEEIARLYQRDLEATDVVGREQMVAWLIRQIGDDGPAERIEAIFKRLFSECPESTELSVERWLDYVARIASCVECRIEEGDPAGVACLSLQSAESSPATHMILMGLTEGALRQGQETGVLFGDVLSLGAQFGFHLSSSDQARLEFAARWLAESPERQVHLCMPETDFEGAVQAPSWFWLQGARDNDQLDEIALPDSTRWDEIQRSDLDVIAANRDWTPTRTELFARSLAEDFGEVELEPFGANQKFGLSASSLEDFLSCGFVFAAKRLFRLSDLPSLDLDVDAITRGSLMHALFERLTVEPMRFDYSDDELRQSIDEARVQAEVSVADERLWPSLQARYVQMARKFLIYEKSWREQFPQTRTAGREVELKGYLDVTTGAFSKEPGENRLPFAGSIDRIDVDQQGHAVIVDYKSSNSGLRQYGAWLDNEDLQLLLYALAFESGLSELEPADVVSAVYYVARTLDRNYGFKTEDVEQGLYDFQDRKRNRISETARRELLATAQARVAAALTEIRQGRFAPRPKDVKYCRTCQWSLVCRASHLL